MPIKHKDEYYHDSKLKLNSVWYYGNNYFSKCFYLEMNWKNFVFLFLTLTYQNDQKT